MILRPDFYHHVHDPREDSPPHLLHPPPGFPPPPPFPPPGPIVFPYPGSHPAQHNPFSSSYPLQRPSYPQQQQLPPFMPPQRTGPSRPRPVHPSLLNDPAFSPDPRSNPYFFSMNDREEIYPASLSDSLSDYASTAPDDESEVDHANLPPRLRLLHSPDAGPPQPLLGHARSQSVPYPPIAPPDQHLARSNSTRVIPVPPPISRTSTPGSHLRNKQAREDPRQNAPAPSPFYASASLAARDVWQPPPPYPDSDSSSSSTSSSPQQTPASSSSHLPRDAQRSTSSLTRGPAPAPSQEKSSPTRTEPPPPSNAPSARSQTQPAAPIPVSKTSTVQSSAVRPPITPRNASAPELHPPPPPTDVPPRPSTVPIATPPNGNVSAPVAQCKRSKNTSIAAPPRDLDRIDELDESDPLGLPWHHDGPYEAIMKAVPVLYPDQSILAKKRNEPPKRKPVEPYDSLSLGVSPGQIFPSNSQYQPPAAAAQNNPTAQTRASDDSPPNSTPPSSPPLQVPVQRRMPSSGQLPSSPVMYNNVHMSAGQAQAPQRSVSGQESQSQGPRSQQQQQQPLTPPSAQAQRARHAADEAPQPSPPLPNPYSPAEPSFPSGSQNPSQSANQGQRSSPPRPSAAPSRSDLPSSSTAPRPDISMPPQQAPSVKSSGSLLPRHLPKKLVMPAPLQPLQQQQQQNQNQPPAVQSGGGVGPGGAHIEVLAQRHVNHPPQSTPSARTAAPSMAQTQSLPQPQPQHHQQRAQDIPMNQGPKVLRKRHTTSGAASSVAGGESAPASNATAALFAARVRFAEPPREETKEERKKREKEEARRQKEMEKLEKERAKAARGGLGLFGGGGGGGGIFVRDHVKEAELAREREVAKAVASVKSTSGRKLSKRR
ncbi:hypothetical protein OH77DRAFT_1516341 [Trametes cingulata]|nr:hypothetical protein OH77DRAFT_1516341 [Trametes cingulata]